MGNSLGGGGATFDSSMRAFDQLPAAAREAYRNAVENLTANAHAKAWKRGTVSPGQIVADVKRWNANELASRTAARAAARGPYKGMARSDLPASASPRKRKARA